MNKKQQKNYTFREIIDFGLDKEYEEIPCCALCVYSEESIKATHTVDERIFCKFNPDAILKEGLGWCGQFYGKSPYKMQN